MIQKSYKINRRKISMIQNQKSSESVVPNHFKNKLDPRKQYLEGPFPPDDPEAWLHWAFIRCVAAEGGFGGMGSAENQPVEPPGPPPKRKGEVAPKSHQFKFIFFICFWFLSHNFKFLLGDIGKVHK